MIKKVVPIVKEIIKGLDVLFIIRFVIGSTLFTAFVLFAKSDKTNCSTPISTSVTSAYIAFFIIIIILFVELGYVIIRTRAYKNITSEAMIMFRAVAFLFDSVYLMLVAISAFAILYTSFPVIESTCVSGRNALYFSMVTFTTLGYGDLTPRDEYQIIVAGQAVLGYIVLGLIVGYAGSLFTRNIEEKVESKSNSEDSTS